MDVFRSRIENFIYDSWKVFGHKVGNEVIHINQEVSMQLNYAYLLKKHIDYIIYDKKEKIDIELEYAYAQKVNNQHKTIDILLKTSNGKETLNIPIELKCYRQHTNSSNKWDVHDIFMKDVYVDLESLEQYASVPHFAQGYALIMTDDKSLAYPSESHSDIEISQGHEIKDGIYLTSPIGGKDIDIKLEKSYRFEWHQHGDFWFSLIQGI